MTMLADVVTASRRVAATASRSQKVAILAELLARLEPDEVPIVAGFLSGAPRQGRVGIGYATVYRGVATVPADKPTLTVADLDHAVTEVQSAIGPGSGTSRRGLVRDLLERATSDEADFVRRLFTDELRQGALGALVIEAVAKAAAVPVDLARRALMLSGDLGRTAGLALTGGEQALRSIGFELFRPIFPMLASTAENVAEAVASFERSSVEWKLDGIRIQIHRRGDEVRIYTRNLNEITDALPGIVSAVHALPLTRAVLDGEALWLRADGPATFQETVSQIDRDAPPEGIVTFLFDALHVDGEDLLDVPLAERAALLERIAPHLRIPGVITADPAEGERVLEEALAAGHEGVVVKDAASLYAAGRRGKSWRKVK